MRNDIDAGRRRGGRQRDPGVLLAAAAGLVAGLLALTRGGINYFGSVEVSGTQAQVLGWLSIAFSIVIFLVYLRGTKRN